MDYQPRSTNGVRGRVAAANSRCAVTAAGRRSLFAACLRAMVCALAALGIAAPTMANLSFAPLDAQLVSEKVEIRIRDEQAVVSGTFEFDFESRSAAMLSPSVWSVYVPVYAGKDASISAITPRIWQGWRKLSVVPVNEKQSTLPPEFRGLCEETTVQTRCRWGRAR
ncbi:MAG: hypothetical protein ACKV19_04955 [Verrucomicrobiales bacterium]